MLESTEALARDDLQGRYAKTNIEATALIVFASAVLDVLQWLIELPEAIFHGYSSLIRWAADSVHSLYDSYGYWVVFFGTLAENTLLLGLIVPGAFVIILAGISAEEGAINVPWTIVLGTAGTILGDTISYFMGRFGWTRLGNHSSLRGFTEKVREPLLKRGAMFVLFYHFAGYTRVVGPAAAGLLQMPYRRWAPADYGGAFLWVCTYLGIGYILGLLGLTLTSTDGYFRYIEYGLLVLVGIWGYYVYRLALRQIGDHEPDEPGDAAEPAGSTDYRTP